MTVSIHLLEQVARVTPLALRFWDEVSGSVIGEGLVVSAYPLGNPERRTQGMVNRSGVYLLQILPGLYDAEIGRGDDNFWHHPPVKRPFVIEVTDMNRRFQPFSFNATLPVRGLFSLACLPVASPPASAACVPLYSAPPRAVPGAMAVLRTELYDPLANTPAAWAVLQVRLPGLPPKTGFADQQGRLALIFPYPEPLQPGSGSSPAANHLPLLEQKWPAQVQAFYSSNLVAASTPDLCQVFQQTPATLLASLSPATPFLEATLEFGKELVLKSQTQSVLYILPAASPP